MNHRDPVVDPAGSGGESRPAPSPQVADLHLPYDLHLPEDERPQPDQEPGGYPGVRGAVDPDDMTLPLYSASFGASVKRFFKGYVRFKGQASKSEYWKAQLFQVLVTIVLGIVLVAVTVAALADLSSSEVDRLRNDESAMMDWVFGTPSVATVFVIAAVWGLAVLLPDLALSWRRLQDANVRGAWALLTLVLEALRYVPGVGTLISLGALAWWIVVGTLSTKPEGQRFDRA